MYVVTFYSFKGGVGRSMALMNCAASLVGQGKKVLVVDFDLEAPGLETFDISFDKRLRSKGIVDYVSRYLSDFLTPPQLNDYVHRCSFGNENSGKFWLMPAGDRRGKYHQKLSSINWVDLYENNDGYLMIENLKAQWKELLNPDYVLVDSRTGHTDVSGICTRQLPNAVVFLFVPNQQNLLGLIPIVKRVRSEIESWKKQVQIHFVASNVPNLDDEHEILQSNLNEFKSKLNYERLTATIRHYQSLALLEQRIFTAFRPKSQLAREYATLTEEVQKSNSEDKVGALKYLKQLDIAELRYHQYLARISDAKLKNPADRIVKIFEHHKNNPEIVKQIVKIKLGMGELEECENLLQQALQINSHPDLLILNGRVKLELNNKKTAAESLVEATKYENLTIADIMRIVRLLQRLLARLPKDNKTSAVLSNITEWKSVKKLNPRELSELAIRRFCQKRHHLAQAEKLLLSSFQKLSHTSDQDLSENVINDLSLVLIGQRKFSDAIQVLKLHLKNSDENNDTTQTALKLAIANLFNLAIATWGETNEVPIDDFRKLERSILASNSKGSANFYQCVSLIYFVLGENARSAEFLNEARQSIEGAFTEEFSCWSYLYLSPKEFLKDLAEQEAMIKGAECLPKVLQD